MTPLSRRRTRAAVLASCLLVVPLIAAAQSRVGSSRSTTVVAAYIVVGGAARADPDVSVTAARRQACDSVEAYVWNALPRDAKARVSRLELFVVPASAEDASDGTVIENDDGVTWTLSLDEGEGENAVLGGAASDREVFDEVVVHEVAHVLSLNKDQRAHGKAAGRYADDEGPFGESSYLNRFYQKFWKGRYREWSADGGRDQAAGMYDRHPDSFVTDYAATDPSEDFAESFATFVLGRRSTSQTERGAKIRFFYDFPELVADRDLMRAALSSAR